MYNFTTKWFNNTAKQNWEKLIPYLNPSKILEIGSFEGAATCFLIEKLATKNTLEITCIDTWKGSMEHKRDGIDMDSAEQNFDENIKYAISKFPENVSVLKIKGFSEIELMKLFIEGKKNYFDFIYVDGSHATVDVLSDGILSFKLLKRGGVMCFDDYAWAAGEKHLDYFPKIAIDAFTTIHGNKIQHILSTNTQVFILKLSN